MAGDVQALACHLIKQRRGINYLEKQLVVSRVASLALKEPNFSILASFDFVWLLKISFGFFLFFGSFWLLFE
jgi:hypothetical protein